MDKFYYFETPPDAPQAAFSSQKGMMTDHGFVPANGGDMWPIQRREAGRVVVLGHRYEFLVYEPHEIDRRLVLGGGPATGGTWHYPAPGDDYIPCHRMSDRQLELSNDSRRPELARAARAEWRRRYPDPKMDPVFKGWARAMHRGAHGQEDAQ